MPVHKAQSGPQSAPSGHTGGRLGLVHLGAGPKTIPMWQGVTALEEYVELSLLGTCTEVLTAPYRPAPPPQQ
jgi:hypothetical protein